MFFTAANFLGRCGCREATSARDEKWVLANLASPEFGSDERLFRSSSQPALIRSPVRARSLDDAGQAVLQLHHTIRPRLTLRRYHLPPEMQLLVLEVRLEPFHILHTLSAPHHSFLLKPVLLLHASPHCC